MSSRPRKSGAGERRSTRAKLLVAKCPVGSEWRNRRCLNFHFLKGKSAMRIFNKKVVVVVAALALVGLGGGTALAYWSSAGTGTGSATTGTSTNWLVTSDAATGAALTPGGPTDTVLVHVKNPGSGVQHLNAVTAVVAESDGTPWTIVSGCSAADYTVTIAVAPGDVAAGATVNGSATIKMIDTGLNQDGCKLASVPLYFAAS
jgi:hypothetical protein